MIKLLAGIMIAIGILVATGSGLCSLIVIFGMGTSAGGGGLIPVALVIGGVPFSVGVGLIAWGRKLLKDNKPLSLDDLNDRFE